jgi:hypothetical protein
MSQDGVARLEEIVRAVVIGAEGRADPSMKVLAAELRTHPNLLLEALKELSDLGSESRPRAPDAVAWARGVVKEVLRTFGFHDRGPNLGPAAQGIVDLLARETDNYVATILKSHP